MTNKEAIDLIRVAQAEVEWEYIIDYVAAFEKAIEALNANPVKHGYWYNEDGVNEDRNAICSVCNVRSRVNTKRNYWGIWENASYYCPNCGSKMSKNRMDLVNEKHT